MKHTEANASLLARAMAKLLAGGLVVDDNEREYPYEHAIMYVAAAQLRAVNVALSTPEPDPPEAVNNERGWCRTDDNFNVHNAMAAIGAVATMLDVAHSILPIVREELERGSEASNG